MAHTRLTARFAPILLTLIFGLPVAPAVLWAESEAVPTGVGVTERLGQSVPLDVELRDEAGKSVTIDGLLRSTRTRDGKVGVARPLVIVPGYYRCPRLCTVVFNTVRGAVAKAMDHNLMPGRDYTIVSVSFNPLEKPALAATKGKGYRSSLNPALPANGWMFLTGSKPQVTRLLKAVGYRYRRDGKDFSHPAAAIIVSPTGKISRYLGGALIPGRDLRFALIEASSGKIGSPLDRAFQLCFRWDNSQGKYAPVAWTFIRIGGLVTLTLMIALFVFLFRLERKT